MIAARNSARYLAGFLLGLCLTGSLVFAFNCLIDPLWFFGGNRLQAKNFTFNERISKSVWLDRHQPDFDCLIMGSSRATLIDTRDIPNSRCFNYSVGGGTLADSLHLAKFAGQKIDGLTTVFVSVDDFNWIRGSALDPNNPIRFSQDIQTKLSPSKYYFGLSALVMSVRTFLDSSPTPRYYGRDFSIQVRADAPTMADGVPRDALAVLKLSDVQIKKNISAVSEAIQGIRAVFPRCRLVGFVPFTSTEIIAANLDKVGVERYMEAQISIAAAFDDFYDFSIISSVTTDPNATYDGGHYFPKANALLMRQMVLQEESDISVRINAAARLMPEFLNRYQARLTRQPGQL